ncbi:kynureninase [Aminivibrio sp.]|jgi:kynureninase|uniref:kynureninase n=1 Tax=Aminivibrio sp. TaxID=1872489 RepID=UPI001A5C70DA|nr:kynureninase [Aminivibrio sp.]MBL3540003.1 kynureninase [Aminivibrio sp.]
MDELFAAYRSKAGEMDRWDSLKSFRELFHIPPGTVFMDGNSLGLPPKAAGDALAKTFGEWRDLAVGGWLEATPPWFYLAEEAGRKMAPLMGASPDEVVMSGSTTVNLHALVSTFYQPSGTRTKIVADELNFPSDIYALASQVRLKGLDPKEHLVLVRSRDGRTLDEDDIIAAFDDRTALALLPGVLYRSGQLLDMERLVKEAHNRGILIGFDCAHSAGAVPHRLSDWDADFAFWCSYKYLNGGPGSPAFLYINRKHFDREPGLAGWFGFDKSRQFDMDLEFSHSRSAGGWQIGTPPVLSASTLLPSLDIFSRAGMERLRHKSLALTGFLVEILDTAFSSASCGYSVGTPREEHRRGGHLAVEHPEAWRICQALKKRKIIPDFRPPRIIRLAPAPLYSSFADVLAVAEALKEIVDSREYENFSPERDAVS